jgi:hypothetical protein
MAPGSPAALSGRTQNRTPRFGEPMNSIPASSSAIRIFSTVSKLASMRPSERSSRRIVESAKPVCRASSSCLHRSRERAALICRASTSIFALRSSLQILTGAAERSVPSAPTGISFLRLRQRQVIREASDHRSCSARRRSHPVPRPAGGRATIRERHRGWRWRHHM